MATRQWQEANDKIEKTGCLAIFFIIFVIMIIIAALDSLFGIFPD